MAVRSFGTIVFLVCLLSLLTSQAFSQDAQGATDDLISVAPADALIAVSLDHTNWSAESLMADLEALDWERANATFQNLITLGEQSGLLEEALYEMDMDSQEFAEIVAGIRGFPNGEGPAYEALVENCAGLTEVDLSNFAFLGDEAVITIGFGAMPIPAVTAITRLSEDQSSTAFEVQQTVIECARADMGEDSVPVLEEGDVNLYVLDDGGDLPVIIGSNNGIFFASTDPNSARTVARLSSGSDEPSLATSNLFERANGRIGTDGIRYAVSFAAIADIAANFKGMVTEEEPALGIIFDRAMAVLRTLGVASGSIGQSADGLEVQTLIAANPEGGDPQLAKLMLCTDCAVSVPELAPVDSVSVASQHLAVSEFFDYLQSWVDELEDMIGPMNAKELLAAQFGVDLDVLLFNWLGDEIHTITMEVPSQKLSTLVYQPAQSIIFPVESVEAAEEAAASFQELWPMVRSLMDMIPEQEDIPIDFFDYVATSEEEYNGVAYTRYRMSVNVDVAVTYIGNNLVTASPAYAIEKIIDVSLGNIENITANPDFETIVSSSAGTPLRSYVDTPQFYSSFAELIGLFSQPAAYFAKIGLDAVLLEGSSYDADVYLDDTTSFFDEDLSSISATPLELSELTSTTINETLAPAEGADSADTSSAFYLLDGLEAGSVVTATLDSTDFDTYMRLIREADGTEQVILDNDDFAGSYEQSQISFMVEEGADYIIEATSYGSDAGGNYSVTVGLGEEISEDFEYFEAYEVENASVPALLEVGSSANGQLIVGESQILASYYALPALNAGDEVTVSIESEDFDTYIYVIDATNGSYVAENDDFEGSYSMSQVNFVAEEGIEYLVKATSFDGSGSGSYSLVLTGAGDAMSTDGVDGTMDVPEIQVLSPEEMRALAPSFGDLLHIAELIPEAMHILADNMDFAEGHTEVTENEIYRHALYRIDW